MQTLFIKKILSIFLFTTFTLFAFAQAENEDGGNNNTPNGSSVLTIANATTFSGDVTNGTDNFDYWTIADGTSDNVTFVLNLPELNYEVRLVTFNDASRNSPLVTNVPISSGETFSLDETKFYGVYILSTSASGFYNITPTFTTVSLPVEVAFFDYKINDSNVQLSWQTLSEKENDYFEIQHSIDGENFEKVSTISGQGTTTEITDYNFTHKNPQQGYNYYRLRQVDFDGSFEYSDVLVVNYETIKATSFEIYPNPADDILNVVIKNSNKMKNIEIYNILGQNVFTQTADNQNELWIDISTLESGVYFLKFDGLIQKFMKR